VKFRLISGRVMEPLLKLKLVPKALVNTALAAPLKVLCPETYSGKGGVLIKGNQLASGLVLIFPSSSPFRIAVIGLKVLWVYLVSQAAIPASARATLSWAKMRALSRMLLLEILAAVDAISFQCPGGVYVPLPSAQKRAIWVCSEVRVVELSAPYSLTSLNAWVYSLLVRLGTPSGRNWEPEVRAKGVILPHCGNSAPSKLGKSGCHFPASR
jgi:hypothetical protein